MKKNIYIAIVISILIYVIYLTYVYGKKYIPEPKPKQKTEEHKKVALPRVEPEKQEEPKVQKYTDEEINSAKLYVGNINHILKGINKIVLKCVTESKDNSDEQYQECNKLAYKKFNMTYDEQSQINLKANYQKQLQIANSK